MHFLELIHIPLPRRMSLLLAQLTGTHLLPGCLPATPLQLDNAALIDWDIYGYIWIFVFLGYIYVSQKKLYVQQLGCIKASLEVECAGGEAQSTAVTST